MKTELNEQGDYYRNKSKIIESHAILKSSFMRNKKNQKITVILLEARTFIIRFDDQV